jgi:hypothetical protein
MRTQKNKDERIINVNKWLQVKKLSANQSRYYCVKINRQVQVVGDFRPKDGRYTLNVCERNMSSTSTVIDISIIIIIIIITFITVS